MEKSEEKEVSGLTPADWENRLEKAASDPRRLAELLAELEGEISREHTFLHDDPEPDTLLSLILDFFGLPDDNDFEGLGKRIEAELAAERWLKKRYRSWLPGEEVLDRIFPYIKNFGADVREERSGLQFPGFLKYKGIRWGKTSEAYVLYLSERFPGREPANFHLLYAPAEEKLVIKRVYRKELPRIEGIASSARAVLTEMAADIVPSLPAVRALLVDNAANVETRRALISSRRDGDDVVFALRPDAEPAATPLGNLMVKLARELGLVPGRFSCQVCAFGMLKIELGLQLPPA
jgi:hypothetical protein